MKSRFSCAKNSICIAGGLALLSALTGCFPLVSSKSESFDDSAYDTVDANGEYRPQGKRLPEGVVQYVWEEPMVDVVEVPPGLDPEGHYYRPAHREVVEIRQGRWQYYDTPKARSNQ